MNLSGFPKLRSPFSRRKVRKTLSRLSFGYFLADLVTFIGTLDLVFGEIDR